MKIDRDSAAATYDSTWRVFSRGRQYPERRTQTRHRSGREAMKIERAGCEFEVADSGLLREVHKSGDTEIAGE